MFFEFGHLWTWFVLLASGYFISAFHRALSLYLVLFLAKAFSIGFLTRAISCSKIARVPFDGLWLHELRVVLWNLSQALRRGAIRHGRATGGLALNLLDMSRMAKPRKRIEKAVKKADTGCRLSIYAISFCYWHFHICHCLQALHWEA